MSIQALLRKALQLLEFSIQIPVKSHQEPLGMGSSGLEPPTSRLSGARSNLLSYEPVSRKTFLVLFFLFFTKCSHSVALTGYGDDGIRTHDPLLAGQVLSQLSYTPVGSASTFNSTAHSKLNNNTYFVLHCYL